LYKIVTLITQSAIYTPKSPKFPLVISGPVFPQFKNLQTLTFSHWIWKSKSSKFFWSKTIEIESEMMGVGIWKKTVMKVELYLQAPSLMVMWEKRLKMI